MPTLSRPLTRYPKRSIQRIGACSVVLVSLITTGVTWRGSPFAVLLTIALSSLTIILFAMAQRALHIASTTIEKILQEELDMHGVHVDNDVATEKEQRETGTMT